MDVSSTSSPVRWADDKPRLDGVRDLVIAWTLSIEMRNKERREDGEAVPMKGPGQD